MVGRLDVVGRWLPFPFLRAHGTAGSGKGWDTCRRPTTMGIGNTLLVTEELTFEAVVLSLKGSNLFSRNSDKYIYFN
jgi:hypothetical protein